jgi:hypothetical protein
MAIIRKKIGTKEYSYLVTREGSRVVHRYLGPVHGAKAQKMTAVREGVASVPERFRSLFWDTALENINLKTHGRYIVEKVLEFGDLDSFNWLCDIYPGWQIRETLLISRNLSEKSCNFWTIWFEGGDA